MVLEIQECGTRPVGPLRGPHGEMWRRSRCLGSSEELKRVPGQVLNNSLLVAGPLGLATSQPQRKSPLPGEGFSPP